MSPADRSRTIRRLAWSGFVVALLIGAALRFAWLDRPAVWGDEALVAGRTSGSFAILTDHLRVDGFMPMQYLLTWWLRVGMPLSFEADQLQGLIPHTQLMAERSSLSPFLLRLMPALWGVAMIPAMAWLAFGLLPKRAAWKATLLAAFSAYLLVYARDAKMYAPVMTLTALHVAAGVSWLKAMRDRRPATLRWALWASTGIFAASYHAVALIALLPDACLVGVMLGHRMKAARTAATLALFAVGVSAIAAVPYFYAKEFNRFTERAYRVEPRWRDRGSAPEEGVANLNAAGIGWISRYNRDRNGLDHAWFCTTAYMTGWEWPRQDQWDQLTPFARKWLTPAAVVLIGVIALGVLPWRTYFGSGDRETYPLSRWRAMWVVAPWLVLPAYTFIRLSVKADPWSTVVWLPVIAIAAAALIAFGRDRKWHPRSFVAGLIFTAVLSMVIVAIGYRAVPQTGSIWMPRYTAAIVPALLLAVAVLIDRLPTWPLRGAVLVLFVAVNMTQFGLRVLGQSEPPSDLIGRDQLNSWLQQDTTMFFRGAGSRIGAPGDGTVRSVAANYYSTVEGYEPSDQEKRRKLAFISWPVQTLRGEAQVLERQLTSRRFNGINHLIIWLESDATEPSPQAADFTGQRFELVSEQNFEVRDHWTWRRLYHLQRLEYRRMPASALGVQTADGG